jgi:membrane protein EpsK
LNGGLIAAQRTDCRATVSWNTGDAEIAEQSTVAIVQSPQKGRFAVNLAANAANFGLSILVGLWLTPYLIRNLGVAAYGLVPLAVTAASYLSLLTLGLNAAVGRFMTVCLDQNDVEESNRVFNTSLWGSVVILLACAGPAIWVSLRASTFFEIPQGYESSFTWVFLCAVGVVFLTILGTPFSAVTFCRNRFDLSNLAAASGTMLRVCVIVALFTLCGPEIRYVGTALLLSSFVVFLFSLGIWRYLTPMLRVQPSCFNWTTLRQLTGTGGWMLVDQIGAILFLSIDLIVVNKMLGPEAGGEYGALLTWSSMLRSLAAGVTVVFAPTIVSLYGLGKIERLVGYLLRAGKFLGLTIALPIGAVCGFSGAILRVWLGPTFEPLAPLLVLMVIPLCAYAAVLPVGGIPLAANRVRLPAIVTCGTGIINLGLAILLAGPCGWGMYGVAAAGLFVFTARNFVFVPLYATQILGVGRLTFYRSVLPAIGLAGGVACVGWFMDQLFYIDTWPRLVVAGLFSTGAYVGVTSTCLLSPVERREAIALVWSRRRKKTA